MRGWFLKVILELALWLLGLVHLLRLDIKLRLLVDRGHRHVIQVLATRLVVVVKLLAIIVVLVKLLLFGE
jgi:hypothetical protein